MPLSLISVQVKPVLGIFSDDLLSALNIYKESLVIEEGTAVFIQLITRWWKIVNVKRTSTGKRKRDPLQEPIFSADSIQVDYLRFFNQFLDNWSSPGLISLSTMTMPALRLTTTSLLCLIEQLLPNFSYVLLGKFQSDVIESRFGEYRQLGGARYHVTVSDVLQAEKKIRMKVLISRTKTHGPIRLQLEQLEEFTDTECSTDLFEDDVPISYLYLSDSVDISVPEKETTTFIAGYIQRKLQSGCSTCAQLPRAESSGHLDNVNRGGLVVPSVVLLSHIEFWLQVFKTIVKEKECDFFNRGNVRSFLCSILFRLCSIESLSYHADDKMCIRKAIFTFVNIILKDFVSKTNREICNYKKQVSDKRKLKKLSANV